MLLPYYSFILYYRYFFSILIFSLALRSVRFQLQSDCLFVCVVRDRVVRFNERNLPLFCNLFAMSSFARPTRSKSPVAVGGINRGRVRERSDVEGLLRRSGADGDGLTKRINMASSLEWKRERGEVEPKQLSKGKVHMTLPDGMERLSASRAPGRGVGKRGKPVPKGARGSHSDGPRIKGPWTKEEDEMLRKLVEQHGPKKWSLIATFIPGRIGKQCRERWLNHLDTSVRKTPWTEAEDRILLAAQLSKGNRWCEIAKMLDGRPENAVKNRWNSLQNRKIARAVQLGQLPPESLPGKRKKKTVKKKKKKNGSAPNLLKNLDSFVNQALTSEQFHSKFLVDAKAGRSRGKSGDTIGSVDNVEPINLGDSGPQRVDSSFDLLNSLEHFDFDLRASNMSTSDIRASRERNNITTSLTNLSLDNLDDFLGMPLMTTPTNPRASRGFTPPPPAAFVQSPTRVSSSQRISWEQGLARVANFDASFEKPASSAQKRHSAPLVDTSASTAPVAEKCLSPAARELSRISSRYKDGLINDEERAKLKMAVLSGDTF